MGQEQVVGCHVEEVCLPREEIKLYSTDTKHKGACDNGSASDFPSGPNKFLFFFSFGLERLFQYSSSTFRFVPKPVPVLFLSLTIQRGSVERFPFIILVSSSGFELGFHTLIPVLLSTGLQGYFPGLVLHSCHKQSECSLCTWYYA